MMGAVRDGGVVDFALFSRTVSFLLPFAYPPVFHTWSLAFLPWNFYYCLFLSFAIVPLL